MLRNFVGISCSLRGRLLSRKKHTVNLQLGGDSTFRNDKSTWGGGIITMALHEAQKRRDQAIFSSYPTSSRGGC